ncbi:MAG: hypothetical protein LUD19_03030 [Clostridia bacterium]|nr:hypothetical protein [Clostridia bacterium]
MREQRHSIEEIRRHKLSKQSTRAGADCDLLVTRTNRHPSGKEARTNFYFYHPTFAQYSYVTFYLLDDTLYMELSDDDNDGSAYKLTRDMPKTYGGTVGITAQVGGKHGTALTRFVGKHRTISQYKWERTAKEPIYYIQAVEEE